MELSAKKRKWLRPQELPPPPAPWQLSGISPSELPSSPPGPSCCPDTALPTSRGSGCREGSAGPSGWGQRPLEPSHLPGPAQGGCSFPGAGV